MQQRAEYESMFSTRCSQPQIFACLPYFVFHSSSEAGLHTRLSMNLFDDDSPEISQTLPLKVNKGYADRFEKRKRNQELAQLKARHGTLPDSESEESEDDEGDMLTADLDLKILQTIDKIKNKRPEVYDSSAKWFDARKGDGDDHKDDAASQEDSSDDNDDDEEEESDEAPAAAVGKVKKHTLRDQLLTQGADALASDSDDDDDAHPGASKPYAYDSEQKDLRRAFMAGANKLKGGEDDEEDEGSGEDGDQDGLLRATGVERAEGGPLYGDLLRQKLKSRVDNGEEGQSKTLQQYLASSAPELNSDERFLRDYVVNARWKPAEDEDEGEEGSRSVACREVGTVGTY